MINDIALVLFLLTLKIVQTLLSHDQLQDALRMAYPPHH